MAVTPDNIVSPQKIITGTAATFGVAGQNTNYDAPTNTFQVLPVQAGGARITRVWASLGSGARPASDCQLYGLRAGVFRLIRVIAVPLLSVGIGNTAAIPPLDFGFSDSFPLFLAGNEALVTGVSVNQPNLNIRAEGGAYWDATMPPLAAGNSIITPQIPVTGQCKLTVAGNGDYTFPSNTVRLIDGQPNGQRITKVQAIPVATTVAGDVELYSDDGTNKRHIMTLAVPVVAIAAGNLNAIVPLDFGFSEANPLYLGPGEALNGGLSSGQTGIVMRAEGGAY